MIRRYSSHRCGMACPAALRQDCSTYLDLQGTQNDGLCPKIMGLKAMNLGTFEVQVHASFLWLRLCGYECFHRAFTVARLAEFVPAVGF